MSRAYIVLIALLGGCFNHCDYDDDCPSSSQLATLDGRLCDSDRQSECSNGTTTCSCDYQTERWNCETERADLAVRPPDLRPAAVGCDEYVSCLVQCFQNTVNASISTCEASCAPNASGSAVLRYGAAVTCTESYCTGSLADAGGAGACLRAPDGALLNEDGSARSPTDSGTGQKRCNLCLHEAQAKLYGATCTLQSSPDCNPTACTAAVDACLAD